MKFTKIPTNTFKQLQLNAGILLTSFTPSNPSVTLTNIIGATSGGVNFSATPSFKDFGEDVDNCPKNSKELKRLDSWDVKMSGTFLTVTTATVEKLLGAGDVDTTDTTKVTPRADLDVGDFTDLWWVGDYSDVNEDGSGTGGASAGFIAIHMMNTLSTGGFQLQSGDKNKGTFAFEFTAHYAISSIDTVPFEIYVKEGTSPTTPTPPAGSGG